MGSCFSCRRQKPKPVPVNNPDWKDSTPTWKEFSSTNGQVVARDGREIWMIRLEKKSDQTVIFIHGGGGRAEQWHHQIQAFDKKGDINIIAVDMLGHGRGSKPLDGSSYRAEQMIADLDHIIKTYATSQTIVVGHSIGSSYAMHLAANQNPQITRVVLLGTGFTFPAQKHPIWKLSPALLEFIRPIISKASKKTFFHPSMSEEFVLAQARVADQNPFFVMKPLITGVRWPETNTLKKITQPTLILQGDGDKIFNDAHLLPKHISHCQLKVFDKCGHNLMLEQPEHVSQAISEFISSKI